MNACNFTDRPTTDSLSSSSTDNPSTSDVSTPTSIQDDDMIAGQVEMILRNILIQRQSSTENLQCDIDSGSHQQHQLQCAASQDLGSSSIEKGTTN